jgi:hypothetical protein
MDLLNYILKQLILFKVVQYTLNHVFTDEFSLDDWSYLILSFRVAYSPLEKMF